jgi:hypothetical protein
MIKLEPDPNKYFRLWCISMALLGYIAGTLTSWALLSGLGHWGP